MEVKDVIVRDFDKIANLEESKWEHNKHYHNYLMRHIPLGCEKALDVGCGKGDFTRVLAEKSKMVIGLDMAPQMIKKAEEKSRNYDNIKFEEADFQEYTLEDNDYDCIVSIATFHHLAMKEDIDRIKKALRPRGVLLILDLYEEHGFFEKMLSIIATPLNLIMMYKYNKTLKRAKEEIEIWNEHGKNDNYLTFKEIKTICDELLPGAIVQRHLFWRYSIVWHKE